MGLEREYLIYGTNDSLTAAYHSYQVDTAVLDGAEISNAKIDMKQVLDFEVSLAKVKLSKLSIEVKNQIKVSIPAFTC